MKVYIVIKEDEELRETNEKVVDTLTDAIKYIEAKGHKMTGVWRGRWVSNLVGDAKYWIEEHVIE